MLFYVPLLYSCSAMLGVLMTSVCTPVGFSHLFIVLGKIIVQPKVSYICSFVLKAIIHKFIITMQLCEHKVCSVSLMCYTNLKQLHE